MTEQESAKKLLPIIQAIAEGKKIQYSFNGVTWFDKDTNLGLNIICNDIIYDSTDYRIKPEEDDWKEVKKQCDEAKRHLMFSPNPKGYNVVVENTNELIASIEIGNNEVIERNGYKVIPFYSEGNYTIEQNTGVNRVEGGVLSVSGSISEKHYKPFEDTAELMVHYSKHFNIDFPPFYEPIIWVKNKSDDTRYLIIGFEESRVLIGNSWFTLKDLFRQCVFLDGSPVGMLEE